MAGFLLGISAAFPLDNAIKRLALLLQTTLQKTTYCQLSAEEKFMRFQAYPSEMAALPTLSNGERLDYFLLRAFETDEIWALKQAGQWFARPLAEHCDGFAAGTLIMPLWCYRHYCQDAALDIWTDCRPDAVALEYCLETEIPRLTEAGIVFDIMPRSAQPGCLITPQQLLSIFNGLMDAGEYRLEG